MSNHYHLLVDKNAYLLELCRYIDLNPVREGMVKAYLSGHYTQAEVGEAYGVGYGAVSRLRAFEKSKLGGVDFEPAGRVAGLKCWCVVGLTCGN